MTFFGVSWHWRGAFQACQGTFTPSTSLTPHTLSPDSTTHTEESTGITAGAIIQVQGKATWRKLSGDDIGGLVRVADEVHPELPESDAIFAERVRLFPEGCLALIDDESGELCGYIISHPIYNRQPPRLNRLLGDIASGADQYYIHDIAILLEVRGHGYAREIIETILSVAGRFPTTSLVSVHGTSSFRSRFGFKKLEKIDEALQTKSLDYGTSAVYLERTNV
jgi:GNAT superfamily N-acetyltransferase